MLQPAGTEMATQDQVRALHDANPQLTAAEIAKTLDCNPAYVRATAQRLRISLPKKNEGVIRLGHAAQDAGMTTADIEAWAKERGR